jgi:hypothetical protein
VDVDASLPLSHLTFGDFSLWSENPHAGVLALRSQRASQQTAARLLRTRAEAPLALQPPLSPAATTAMATRAAAALNPRPALQQPVQVPARILPEHAACLHLVGDTLMHYVRQASEHGNLCRPSEDKSRRCQGCTRSGL